MLDSNNSILKENAYCFLSKIQALYRQSLLNQEHITFSVTETDAKPFKVYHTHRLVTSLNNQGQGKAYNSD